MSEPGDLTIIRPVTSGEVGHVNYVRRRFGGAAMTDAMYADRCAREATVAADEVVRIARAMRYLATKGQRPWWARRATTTPNAILDR